MKTKLHTSVMAMGLIYFLFVGITSTAQIIWYKYDPGNPVLTEFGTTWAADGVHSPSVIYENGIFKMWFSAGGNIGYAISLDGVTWNPNNDPVIGGGNPGTWDEERNHPYVIRVNDTLKMWYAGSADGFNWEISIGYAWRVDDADWEILDTPVLERGEPGSWDENAVYKPAVYYDGNTYHMWYNGYEGTLLTDPDRVGYATSSNGINWVKDTIHNPVMNLGEPGTFFDTWVQSSCVLFREDEYKMWFSGYDATTVTPLRYLRIGYATSPDGIEWTIQNDSMAIIDHGFVGAWDESRVVYPSVLFDEDEGYYKMWYTGFNYYTYRIGYATSSSVGFNEINDPSSVQVTFSPNPFTTSTTIDYELKQTEKVTLSIYNQMGKQVYQNQENQPQGKQSLIWNAEGLSPGVYHFRLQAGEQLGSGKMVLLK